jgi:hypothetical protein
MCDAGASVAAAALVISATTTAYNIKEQRDQAAKQQKLMKQQSAAQERAAKEARRIDQLTVDKRAEEIEAKGSSQTFERVRQAAREAAKLKLSSAEAGVFGTSVFRQLMSSDIQEMHDIGLIQTDTANELAQNKLTGMGVEATFASRMNEAKMTKKSASLYSGPSALGATMQIGSAAFNAGLEGYGMGSRLSIPSSVQSSSTLSAQNSAYKNQFGGSI